MEKKKPTYLRNVLPPHVKTWTDLLNTLLHDKFANFDIKGEGPLFCDYMNFNSIDKEHVSITIDRDYLKARVLDEMWDNLDLNQNLIISIEHVLHMTPDSYSLDFSKVHTELGKVMNLSYVRK